MANLIQLKRSAVPGHTPTTTQLQPGELAVNSYDGKAYMLQDQTSTGGIQQVIEVGKKGATAVKQVYYVSKSGDDANDGTALDKSKATIRSAVEATRGMNATATATVSGGAINTVTIVNGGAGYVDQNYPPAVTIFDTSSFLGYIAGNTLTVTSMEDGFVGVGMVISSPGVTSATITAFVSGTNGGIGNYTINGSAQTAGLSNNPIMFSAEGGGSGAIVLADIADGQVVGCTVVDGGSGYSTKPQVYITPSGGDAVIFVKSGDYTEINPIYVPRGVSVVGDSLRTTTVRPANPGLDIFWVNNKSYFTEITCRGHEAPSAVFTFPSMEISGITNSASGKAARVKFTGGFTYDRAKCYRDTGLVIDSLTNDLLFGASTITNYGGNGDSMSTFTGLQYWANTGNTIPTNEKAATIAAFSYMRDTLIPPYISVVNTLAYDEMTLIIDILNGNITPSTITDLIVPNGTTATLDGGILADVAALQANKATIATNVTNYITAAYPSLTYDVPTCQRDVGYIIDSICFDIKMPSTTAQAANRMAIQAGTYYLNYSSTVSAVPNEATQVKDAYSYLSTLMGYVITNTPVPAVYQTNKTQTILSNAGTSTQVTNVQNNIQLILDIITNGPTWGSLPDKTPIGLTASSTPAVIYAFDLIVANMDFLIEEVLAYIDGFSYNRPYCERDTGLIIDAIAQDLLFEGDSQTTFAGVQYWTQGTAAANLVIPADEKAATVAAIQQAGYIAAGYIVAGLGDEYSFVVDEFNLIASIIDNGTVQITNTIIPNTITATSDSAALAAFANLQANKASIQADVVTWINAQIALSVVGFAGLVYDSAKCARDIGYMVDSICVDLKYNADPTYVAPSNRQAVQCGVYYYGYEGGTSYVVGELAATSSAYDYIKYLATYIVQGDPVPNLYQTDIAQVIPSDLASINEVNTIYSMVDNMVNIITVGPRAAGAPQPIKVTETSNLSIRNAAQAMYDNRAFIVAEVLAYVDDNFTKGHPYQDGDTISIRNVQGMVEINNGYAHQISDITSTVPVKVTFSAPHTLDNRSELKIYGVIGMSEINARRYYAEYVSTTEVNLFNDVYLTDPVDGTLYGSYTSGGSIETDSFFYVKKINYNQCDLYLDRALTKPVDSNLYSTYINGGVAGTGSLPMSPYVHNCSSITTTGTGMRVDGNLSTGLRSMVLDSFTQINEGGVGIEILNRGYAQLVSIYTICTDKGVYAHGGGFCSMENSNSSFGNYALYADGLSEVLYSGATTGVNQTGKSIALKGMTKKPSYDDAMGITSTLSISNATIRSGGGTVNASNPGSGYVPNDVLTLSGGTVAGGGTPSIFNVASVKAVSAVVTASGTRSYTTGDVLSFNTGFSTALSISVTATAGSITGYTILNPGVKNTPVLGAIHPDFVNGVAVTSNATGLNTLITFTYGVNSVTPTTNVTENYTVVPTGTSTVGNTIVGISTSGGTGTGANLDVYFTVRLTFSDLHYFIGGETIEISSVGGMTQLNGNSYFINLIGSGTAIDIYDDVGLATGVDVTGFGAYTSGGSASVNDYYTVISATDPVVNPADGLITTTIGLEVSVKRPIPDSSTVEFKNRSRIQSSGHGFEFIGSGTVLATATPASGAYPVPGNEVFESNGGKVYFTGTTEQGDFKIGTELTINRDTGTISGRTFDKSLFAIMTPYILALEG